MEQLGDTPGEDDYKEYGSQAIIIRRNNGSISIISKQKFMGDRPLAEMNLGNPKTSNNSEELLLSSITKKPIVFSQRGGNVNIEIDEDDNLIIFSEKSFILQLKEFLLSFQNIDIKTEDLDIKANKTVIDSTEKIDTKTQEYRLDSETTEINSSKEITLSSPVVKIGEIYQEGEEFEEFQIGVEYESVLTEMKFRKWWNSELKPVLEYLKSYIDDKYNNHIHVTPSGNSKPPIGYEGNGSKMDSGTTANKITGSQTLKAL